VQCVCRQALARTPLPYEQHGNTGSGGAYQLRAHLLQRVADEGPDGFGARRRWHGGLDGLCQSRPAVIGVFAGQRQLRVLQRQAGQIIVTG